MNLPSALSWMDQKKQKKKGRSDVRGNGVKKKRGRKWVLSCAVLGEGYTGGGGEKQEGKGRKKESGGQNRRGNPPCKSPTNFKPDKKGKERRERS